MFALTPRLLLRPGWPEDARALAAAINHREIARMTARVPWPYAEADAADFLARERRAHDAYMLIFRRGIGAPVLIGGIGLMESGAADERELGYWLTPAAWGRGYATEAGRAVMDIARHALGLRRVHAGHFADNPASARVLAKLGFRATGRVEPRSSAGRDAPVEMVAFDCVLREGEARQLAA